MTYDSATDTTAVWPVLATISDANKFGKLEISSVVIPEYPEEQYSKIVGLAILLAAATEILGTKVRSKDKITRREYLSATLL